MKMYDLRTWTSRQAQPPRLRSGSRSFPLLDLVHKDVCGPFEMGSVDGARYLFMFIYDHSN